MRIPTLFVLALLANSGCASDPAEPGSEADEAGTTGATTSTANAETAAVPPESDTAETTGGKNPPGSTSQPDPGSSSTGALPPRGSSESGHSASDDSSSSSDTGDSVPLTPECMTYCDEFLPNCNKIAGIQPYDDLADCEATCAGFDHSGVAGTFVGDTVQCRIDHLTFDPNPGPGYYELHCFHTQENPKSQCL